VKKQKPVLMFAKVSTEKVSSPECQRIEKEKKRNSDVCKAECRKKKLGQLSGLSGELKNRYQEKKASF
jgi:hypothetical protein